MNVKNVHVDAMKARLVLAKMKNALVGVGRTVSVMKILLLLAMVTVKSVIVNKRKRKVFLF